MDGEPATRGPDAARIDLPGASAPLALVVVHATPEHEGLLDRLSAEHPEITFVRSGSEAGHPARLAARAADANGRLPEPLTERELEILAYLPDHATNGEIATRCFVSVNTLKTHMAHIYRKFGVSSRSAAIERARELGMLVRTFRDDPSTETRRFA